MTNQATIRDLTDPFGGLIRERSFVPGDYCGSYRIRRLIASGGYGDVYEGIHEVTGRRAAIKVLQNRFLDDPELVSRLEREVKRVSEIRHANMVRVYDAGIDGRCLWLAMELLEGKTLRAVLTSEHTSLTRALDIAIAVAAGAKAAHELRLVHRDLKPENVFITTEGGVVVLDLGTAKVLGETDAKRTERVMGTVAYMSPEHLLGPGEGIDVDQRSDVYSLGIILYEMLAFHPFSRSRTSLELPDVAALAQHQLFTLPIPLPDVAPWVPTYVWQLVEKAIQKDREYRHDSMHEFEIEVRQAQRWYVEEQQRARAERIPVTPREFAVSSVPPVKRPKALGSRDRLLILAPLVGAVLAIALLLGIAGYKTWAAPLERGVLMQGVARAGKDFVLAISENRKQPGGSPLVQTFGAAAPQLASRPAASQARTAPSVLAAPSSKRGKSAESDRQTRDQYSKHRLPSSGL